MKPGDHLTLVIEKPAAGGRMIARHGGAIVLVSSCIPGETVEALVEKVQRGTIWARTLRLLDASPDRASRAADGSCGGCVFSHIRYERQLTLKRDIIRDAFLRIGHLTVSEELPVAGSPPDGYRMRARLHLRNGHLGFFREGTHQLCDPRPTRQLLPATVDAAERLAAAVTSLVAPVSADLEISENSGATERAMHLELPEGTDPSRLGSLAVVQDVRGVSCGHAHSHRSITLWGSPTVTETLRVPAAAGALTVLLSRHAHSFFQGNRFLLPELTAAVVDAVPPGSTLDLYAGVGLFSVALAVRGGGRVTAIEGDRRAADDLKHNAAAADSRIEARHQAVETFLSSERGLEFDTIVVDPPRTGVSREALTGAIRLRAGRLVYVSCDVATLARDSRAIVDAGYRLASLRALDLFPNTAHVETLAVFER